jgi:hypothetical protein
MCKKLGVQVHVMTTQSDIHESNERFQTLFKLFADDVYTTNNNTPTPSSSFDSSASPSSNVPSSSSSSSDYCFPLLIGIDVEWGVEEVPAVIQIASRRACFVVVVARDPSLLAPFRAVLADASVVKAGVGVRADKQKIEMLPGFEVHGEVDLAALVCRTPEANHVSSLSLAGITAYYCGHALNKDLAIVCSDWAAASLSAEQLEYAADDSVAGLVAFAAIMRKHINAGTTKAPSAAAAVANVAVAAVASEKNDEKKNDVDDDNQDETVLDDDGGQDPTSALLAPSEIPTAAETTTSTSTSKISFETAATTTPQIARVQRTPMEWSKKYIKRKVILKQPKPQKSGKNNTKAGTSPTTTTNNGATASTTLSPSDQQQQLEEQDSSSGIIARFESRMERRYQSVSEFHESIKRISTSGVQAVGPDDTNLFCLDALKAAWYVKKGIAVPLEHVDNDPAKPLKRIRLSFTPNLKTKICRTWHARGHCPNATCPFAHGSADLQEDIRAETRQLNASISSTARALAQRSMRERCDMCRAQNAGISGLSCVPGPWLRLMGEEIADATGSSVALHLCCKCQALMRAVFVSERRTLRNNAAKFFVENDLFFGRRKNGEEEEEDSGSDSGEKEDSDKKKTTTGKKHGDDSNMSSRNNSSASNKNEDDDDNDNNNDTKNKNNPSKKKNLVEPESALLSKVNEASMTRMCSLCQLIVSPRRSDGVPQERIRQIVTRINTFYDMMVKEGIVIGRVAPLQQKTKENDDDHDAVVAEEEQKLLERALLIAEQINQFSKSMWLASAEARDIARYWCLCPVDEKTERPAGIVTPQEEKTFIFDLADKLRGEKSLDSLKVAEPFYSAFWAKRMFEHYRTVLEQQLRPVIVPWKMYSKDSLPKQTNQEQE